MAEGADDKLWREIAISLEILANSNYVSSQLDSTVAGRHHVHDVMRVEIANLVALCKERVRDNHED